MNSAVKQTTPAPDGRSIRWEAHRAERRGTLIKAARRAVHTIGAQASMEEIAAASGTSKSVYYRYFGDKSGLQQAMGEVVISQMQDKILSAARSADSPRSGLRAMVSAYLQMAETSPAVYAFVTGGPAGDAAGTNEPGVAAALSDFFANISAMMDHAVRFYLEGHESDAVTQAAAGFWPTAALGMVRAAGERWLATPPGPARPTEAEMTDQLTAWLFDGIGWDSPQPAAASASSSAPPHDRTRKNSAAAGADK
ncbi:TetR family transcriptional regulator [Arthrobacter sp. Sa2BUA2]|uniref:TetR family transcriptional regulator n=1 Tax=Arthrobacter pullicola TaxID=2762224 RepID=A0ABR8YHK8_9MICC|nr:TetR/AcrR family transcriptional regulator [Arthrobacter pullicola]MBD8043699.1 TetR family transcriptional regulator [Arthrobacter pullicola]